MVVGSKSSLHNFAFSKLYDTLFQSAMSKKLDVSRITIMDEFKVNSHVERLRRFLPFRAGVSEIITELQQERQNLEISTRAIEYVEGVIKIHPKLIILTGNAGHGKTYICAQVLAKYGKKSDDEVRKHLRNSEISSTGILIGSHKLRIRKDLSEVDARHGAAYLHESYSQPAGVTTLICVNDGRLREVLGELAKISPDASDEILQALDKCINDGIATKDGQLHIVNLNFQSVVSNQHGIRDNQTMLESAMSRWIDFGPSWSVCEKCRGSKVGCPIYKNRELLHTSDGIRDSVAKRRRQGVAQLFRMAELSGHVTTVREMLMLLAYIITGEMSCESVKKKFDSERQGGWQREYAFHNKIFGVGVKDAQLQSFPLLASFRSFDPAQLASRLVDDRFIRGAGIPANQWDLQFYHKPSKEVLDASEEARGENSLCTGSETEKEERGRLQSAMQILRRRDFFDLWELEGEELKDMQERSRRIGYRSLADMIFLLEDKPEKDRQRLNRIKKELIAGLHAIQGISPWEGDGSELLIVHPAFSRLHRKIALLSGSASSSQIILRAQPQAWDHKGEGEIRLVKEAVDWTPLAVILDIQGEELRLDLKRFEYLLRAGKGYQSRTFYAAEVRRILNFLALVSSKTKSEVSTIKVRTPTGIQQFSYSDGLIQ